MVQVGEAGPGVVPEAAAQHEFVHFAGKAADLEVLQGFAGAVPVGFFGGILDLVGVHEEGDVGYGAAAEGHVNPFFCGDSVCARSPGCDKTCGIGGAFGVRGFRGDMVTFHHESLFWNVAQGVFLSLFEDGLFHAYGFQLHPQREAEVVLGIKDEVEFSLRQFPFR